MTELSINDLFRHSEELLLIVDNDKNVIYTNRKADAFFNNAKSLAGIEHLFSSEVCVLDRENILNYTPLSEAVSSRIPIRAEILIQTGEQEYEKFSLRSFKENNTTLIILSEIPAPKNDKRIAELELLKERAQNLAISTSLINRISNSIRESLNIEEIIRTIIKEITTTLGLDSGEFRYIDEVQDIIESKSVVSTVMIEGKLLPRLVTPVIYRDELLGIMTFYHTNNKKHWHEEEISLIEGISSQLAAAINQSKAQAQLIQAEKMASLGQLVAGVAHEINTPLGSINSNNDILSRCLNKISAPENILEIFNETIKTNFEAIKRITQLVKSLRNFARLDEAEYQEADIHEGIKNTLLLINHEIKNRIEVVQDFGDIPPIKCYPNQLNQVFMNILVNAYQSIEGKGKITIKTEKTAENIQITIFDTGHGIPKDKLRRIFDPGFTTKSVGVGTGLGLSICYRIIQQHNGSISVESEVGKGTAFKIELPF